MSDKDVKKVYKKMLSFDNIGKPANRKWKFASKLLCRVLPVISAAIIPLPISEILKVWLIFFCTVFVSIISTLSEFTTENENI